MLQDYGLWALILGDIKTKKCKACRGAGFGSLSAEAAGARKTKSPAFAGLFGDIYLLAGACLSSLQHYLAETEGFEPSIQV